MSFILLVNEGTCWTIILFNLPLFPFIFSDTFYLFHHSIWVMENSLLFPFFFFFSQFHIILLVYFAPFLHSIFLYSICLFLSFFSFFECPFILSTSFFPFLLSILVYSFCLFLSFTSLNFLNSFRLFVSFTSPNFPLFFLLLSFFLFLPSISNVLVNQ